MPKKNYNLIFNFFLVILLCAYLTNFFGCKKEAEKPEEKPAQQTQVTTPAETTKIVEKPKIVYPDLIGKWTGVFDKRASTLTITKQDTTEFSGKITINYREVINQEISGKLDLLKKEVKMKDLLHSRYAGTYVGKLSDDMNTMQGTFTQNVEKTKFNFNLTKK
jgi:hypothetical protein